MCRRFTRKKKPQQLVLPFKVEGEIPVLEPSYNVAPSTDILSVVREQDSNRFRVFKWGLVPGWAKEPAKFKGMDNARSETAHDKPSFREPFRKRRCLIVADGFYEWRAESPDSNSRGTSKGKTVKQPYYFQLSSGEPFAFAGIYDIWVPKREGYEGLRIESCALLTCEPNPLLEGIHDRMPVILPSEAYESWLNADTPVDELRELLRPYPESAMKRTRVSRYVNYSANDGPQCVEPIEEEAKLFE